MIAEIVKCVYERIDINNTKGVSMRIGTAGRIKRIRR